MNYRGQSFYADFLNPVCRRSSLLTGEGGGGGEGEQGAK